MCWIISYLPPPKWEVVENSGDIERRHGHRGESGRNVLVEVFLRVVKFKETDVRGFEQVTDVDKLEGVAARQGDARNDVVGHRGGADLLAMEFGDVRQEKMILNHPVDVDALLELTSGWLHDVASVLEASGSLAFGATLHDDFDRCLHGRRDDGVDYHAQKLVGRKWFIHGGNYIRIGVPVPDYFSPGSRIRRPEPLPLWRFGFASSSTPMPRRCLSDIRREGSATMASARASISCQFSDRIWML